MEEHIALLEKEIKILEINLVKATKRPGVTRDELVNLHKELTLKSEILAVVKKSVIRKGDK